MTDTEWAKAIRAAQLVTTIIIDGKPYGRICFGNECPDLDIDEYPEKCHDCGVEVGQIHIVECDVERCPKCGGQLIFCECSDKLVSYPDENPF